MALGRSLRFFVADFGDQVAGVIVKRATCASSRQEVVNVKPENWHRLLVTECD